MSLAIIVLSVVQDLQVQSVQVLPLVGCLSSDVFPQRVDPQWGLGQTVPPPPQGGLPPKKAASFPPVSQALPVHLSAGSLRW